MHQMMMQGMIDDDRAAAKTYLSEYDDTKGENPFLFL